MDTALQVRRHFGGTRGCRRGLWSCGTYHCVRELLRVQTLCSGKRDAAHVNDPCPASPTHCGGPLPPQRQRHRGKRQSGGRGRGLGAVRRRVAIFITLLTLRALPDNAAKPQLRGRGGQWMRLCGVCGRSATGLGHKRWDRPLNISGVRAGATMGAAPHGHSATCFVLEWSVSDVRGWRVHRNRRPREAHVPDPAPSNKSASTRGIK